MKSKVQQLLGWAVHDECRLRAGLPLLQRDVRVMAARERFLELEEEFLEPVDHSARVLRVSEHQEPGLLLLEIFSGSPDFEDIEPDDDIVVDLGALRGFLAWLKDGD